MKRFFSHLSRNTLVIILLLGIALSINYLSTRFHGRLDLTADKEYTLSSSTLAILQRLEDRLTVKLYFSQDLPPVLLPIEEEIRDTLREIVAQCPQTVIVENVVPDLNEEVEAEAQAGGMRPLEVNIPEKDKIEVRKLYMGLSLLYRDRREVLPAVVNVQDLEYQLAQSLLKLTQKDMPRVGILLGERADGYQLISQVVREIAEPVALSATDKNIAEKKLSAVMVIDPQELPESMTQELDKLLEAGVNLLLFSGRVAVAEDLKATSVKTGLEAWLDKKGVAVSDRLLLDVRQNMQVWFNSGYGQVLLPYHFWVRALKRDLSSENPVTKQLEEVLFPWTNVVVESAGNETSWEMAALIRSSQNSFLQDTEEPDVNPQYVNTMTNMPVMEPYPLSVILSRKDNKDFGKIFLTASSHAVQDRFLQRSPSNVTFLANLVEFASFGDHLIGIRSRGETTRPLKDLTAGERSLVKWFHLIALPLLAVFFGLGVLFIHKTRRAKLIESLLNGRV